MGSQRNFDLLIKNAPDTGHIYNLLHNLNKDRCLMTQDNFTQLLPSSKQATQNTIGFFDKYSDKNTAENDSEREATQKITPSRRGSDS